MEIIEDLSDLFDGFMIDLTNIGTGDRQAPDKALLISQFEELLAHKKSNNESTDESKNPIDSHSSAKKQLNKLVPESTNIQYHNGL
jgi:putative protease